MQAKSRHTATFQKNRYDMGHEQLKCVGRAGDGKWHSNATRLPKTPVLSSAVLGENWP